MTSLRSVFLRAAGALVFSSALVATHAAGEPATGSTVGEVPAPSADAAPNRDSEHDQLAPDGSGASDGVTEESGVADAPPELPSVAEAAQRGVQSPELLEQETSEHSEPTVSLTRYNDLEKKAIERALAEFGRVVDPSPYGKTVCEISVRSYRIIEKEDFLPMFLNVFHRVTRERAVRRLLTLESGQAFGLTDHEDVERAIRDSSLFSVAVVVPVQSAADEQCVDLLVVTRDVWSLLLSWVVEGNGSSISNLYFGLVETNFLGTTDSLSFNFNRNLGSWDIGPSYSSRRFAGTKLSVSESFRFYYDREYSEINGASNVFQIARPIRDSHEKWGWSLYSQYINTLNRVYIGDTIRRDDPYPANSATSDGWVGVRDDLRFETIHRSDPIPFQWRSRSHYAEATATRSFGLQWKHNLTFGWYFQDNKVTPFPGDDGVYDPAILNAFANLNFPRSEISTGPLVQWQEYENRYFRLNNYNTYGVAEEYRKGYSITSVVRFAEPKLGSSRRVGRFLFSLNYVLPAFNGGFISASADTSFRVEKLPDAADATNDGLAHNLSISGGIRIATPSWLFGRLVFRFVGRHVLLIDGDPYAYIGGNNGLRGYDDNLLYGVQTLQTNLEWRSSPLKLRSTRLGMVVFFDGATAWDRRQREPDAFTSDRAYPDFYSSVGLGGRIVIPQIGTRVRVLDVAFPLRWQTVGGRTAPVRLSFGVDQVF